MELIHNVIKNIHIGDPTSYKNLTVFPLLGKHLREADYLTLDEALEQKCSEVTEVSASGRVPDLKFINSGTKPVFLLDGEHLIGAKQNRVLNLSILIAGGKTVIIPVSCVEAGRWRHSSIRFSSSQSAYYAEGRARKMAQVSASMRSIGRRRSDQSKVWEDIAAKSSRFSVTSQTSAMSDLYKKEEIRLEDYSNNFSVLEGQSGGLFTINGKIVGLELFDSANTLKKLFPKLLNSYCLDAIDHKHTEKSGEESGCSSNDVDLFLKGIIEAKMEEFDAIGEGRDVRLSGKNQWK